MSQSNNDASSLRLRLISFNIRMAAGPKQRMGNEEVWAIRCPYVTNAISFNAILPETFIGLQEVLHHQLLDITKALNAPSAIPGKWKQIGVGREDGKQEGEFEPIFYQADTWTLKQERYRWLSETPDTPSRGWDGACTRVMTIGEFEHVRTKRRAVVINTHLDHKGVVAREEGAKLILKTIDEYAESTDVLFLTGDFNATTDDEAYQTITADGSTMQDVQSLVDKDRLYGNELTYTSFGGNDLDEQKRIDFIFARKKDHVHVGHYAVLSNRFDDGVYASDHRPVVRYLRACLYIDAMLINDRLPIYTSKHDCIATNRQMSV